MIHLLRYTPLFLCLAIAGCATRAPEPDTGAPPPGGYDGILDGYPSNPPDVSTIPDAVPRAEPLSRWGNPASYEVFGQTYYVMETVASDFRERGIASWYGTKFHGRRTSSGEPYDMYAMTAAHKTLPIPAYVRVTNLNNGKQVVVRVNDRGPFARNRIIDLSYAAAHRLDMLRDGTAPVEIELIKPPQGAASAVAVGTEPHRESTVKGSDINYFIQAAAFTERSNAERLQKRLQTAGLGAPVEIHTAELPHGPVYRVRLGPVQAVAQVDRLTARLTEFGIDSPQVMLLD